MPDPAKTQWIADELEALRQSGLFTHIRTLTSPQGAWLIVDGQQVLNFCSNNYLGLASHPHLLEAAKQAIDRYGIGPAAVRTIAGTMGLHLELERRLAEAGAIAPPPTVGKPADRNRRRRVSRSL